MSTTLPVHSVILQEDLSRDKPATNNDYYSHATAIRDIIVNADTHNAKNVLVSNMQHNGDNYVVILNDGDPFVSAEAIRRSLMSNVTVGDAGSQGSGGSSAHRLLNTDPYQAQAIWYSRTPEGPAAYSSRVGIDRRLIIEPHDVSSLEASIARSIPSTKTRIRENTYTVAVALKISMPSGRRTSVTPEVCDWLDIMLPPFKAECCAAIDKIKDIAVVRTLVGRQSWLTAVNHSRFDMETTFDASLGNKIEVLGMKAKIKVWVFDGYCYKSGDSGRGFLRLKNSEERCSVSMSMHSKADGVLMLPFVKDKTLSRLTNSPMYVKKNTYEWANISWNLGICSSIRKTGQEIEKGRGEGTFEVFQEPNVFFEFEITDPGVITSGGETIQHEYQLMGLLFPVNKFFQLCDFARDNVNMLVKSGLKSCIKSCPGVVDAIRERCKTLFPENKDELAALRMEHRARNETKVFLVDRDGRRIPAREFVPNAKLRAYGMYLDSTGERLDEDSNYVPVDHTFGFHKEDTGGWTIAISNYKKRLDNGKFVELTEEQYKQETHTTTFPKTKLVFRNADTGVEYVIGNVIVPNRYTVPPHERTPNPGNKDGESKGMARWQQLPPHKYVKVDGQMVYLNKGQEELRTLFRRIPKWKSFQDILDREITEASKFAYSKALADVSKPPTFSRPGEYDDYAEYMANLAVQVVLKSEKVQIKLKSEADLDHDDYNPTMRQVG